MATTDRPETPNIELASGVSAYTGEPFVHLTWGALKAQLSPDEARQFAREVFECAEAAIYDAACFAFLMMPGAQGVGIKKEDAANFIHGLRKFRADMIDPEESAPAES